MGIANVIWPDLIKGQLIKRYKRFLADVKLENGQTVTAHCPNSGAMATCRDPGRTVYVSYHDNPKRKLKYTWELIEMPTSLVGVNTMVPNRLVHAAIEAGDVAELRGYPEVRREVKAADHTRLDLKLSGGASPPCWVEVKNCTLVEDGAAFFPDAVTTRGLKHIETLEQLISDGCRGVMFYLVQRMDAVSFAPADHIDAAYGDGLRRAVKKGLEVLVYDTRIDLNRITLHNRVPCKL